ncbi:MULTISPECIES: glycosyltransferase [unclassified Thermosynechococcus]|uniref:glycosyltransferase n=1 Tax=unclassified Thermosynechococcus TaxID=2622553 RepID=UPI00197F6570|nr:MULTISPECIES: glycosyltransferase [unclassified Thermosynechococcus]QSF48388.1 glycosyltransferase [Thermosynechococcus sp. TA-1]WNC21423.1 glycosyltransferase [Thermosynechococcus sp. PP22]WNC31663.1 glycosyltransferase [Thermosynechococcus sp. PKX95]WNC34187.1 glycosyltransferase [Thermosynechococcus sp. PKX91]WNC36710.1 glycosyltransferase [Thermosynechococcus sp. WL11]
MSYPFISIITATLNVEDTITRTIKSLQDQTDKNFEWIIGDGASTDSTISIIQSTKGLNIKIISEPDFSLYHAINKSLKIASGDYYLVLGAGDVLEQNTIELFRKAACSTKADILSAHVWVGKRLKRPNRGRPYLFSAGAYISSHAVGTLIKTDLHRQLGYYSYRFPVGADYFFIKTAIQNGCKFHRCDFIAGEFMLGGISSTDKLSVLCDFFRLQVETGENLLLQILILICALFIRVVIPKYIPSLIWGTSTSAKSANEA